jgi:signal transduction histidine kinase
VNWNISDEARAAKLLPDCEESLYHAAREALRNVRRYARGEEISRAVGVSVLAYLDGGIRLIVEDDGVGLGARLPSQGGGQGLILHGALLAVAGGSLLVEERDGGGTRVALHVPL